MYVDPQRWGIGIGRLLMAAARDRLYQDGAREALLWVLAENNRARRFYQLDGWNCDGFRRTEVIGGVTAEELRYRRPSLEPQVSADMKNCPLADMEMPTDGR